MAFLQAIRTIGRHPHTKGRFLHTFAIIFWWKINQLFFHIPAIVEIAPSVKIICKPEDSYGSFIVYALWPEYAELRFIYSILKTGDTYIDVGAHIGDSSLLAASKISTGKVIAVEPTPSVFAQLLANIRLNTYESTIIPLQVAISNTTGFAHFALESESEVNHLQTIPTQGKTIKVRTMTIDSLMEKYSVPHVTLLKIDVEGFELEVLQGAQKSLQAKKIDMILFEVNPSVLDISQKIESIKKLFALYSFAYYAFRTDGSLEKIRTISAQQQTTNFLAVSKNTHTVQRLKKWVH